MKPFCNLTNFFFLLSPNEFASNLLDEEWGCFKHIGMSWDMIMNLPIQDRRSLIRKHNLEQEMIDKEYNKSENEDVRTFEGESINTFAKLSQANKRGG